MTRGRSHRALGSPVRTGAVLLVWLFLGGSCSKAQKVDVSRGPAATVAPGGQVEMPFDPEYPLVVESPDKLFLPGAMKRIQEIMAQKGYLKQFEEEPLGSRTQSAIASFQSEIRPYPSVGTILPSPAFSQISARLRSNSGWFL